MIHVKFDGDFVIRPYTLKELAAYYGVNPRTLRKLMAPFAEEIGPRQGNYYFTEQVAIIVKHLGVKCKVSIENT